MNKTGPCCEPTAKRVDNHIALDDSIDRLESLESRVERLLSRITENPRSDNSATETPPPSLQYVLENGGKKIDTYNERIRSLVDEIEIALFGSIN